MDMGLARTLGKEVIDAFSSIVERNKRKVEKPL
jgi:hypothetical protein